MYTTIKHWDKSAWAGGDPDWTMEVLELCIVQAWGGNYGNASYGIYMEKDTKHIYYITDHQHGQYTVKRLEHLEVMEMHQILSKIRQTLFQNIVKP